SVEAVDKLTVKIQYEEWANNWDNVISDIFICSKEAFEKNGAEWCQINCVGTGPFELASYVADNSVKYKKNENYRIEGQPYIDELEIDFISDLNTRVSSLLNQEVDVAMKFENSEIINTIKAAGFESIGQKNANIADIKHIIWNSKNPAHPMGDLKVRQAIMHCIDWDNVALTLSGGLGEATPLFCTKDSWAYNPEASFYEYNIELAKKMLAEAGYPDGFQTKIYTNSQNVDTATAFQACLKQIKVEASVETMDSSALAAMQKEDDIDGFIANRGSSKMDFTNNYIRLYSSEGIKNHGIMLRPAEFEDPLFAARAAKTIEEKKENLQKAAKALVQDSVMITPLSVVYYQTFAQKNVKDSGIYVVNLEQWTPEVICLTK
ncbi:MAG: ABC transporter substrate-binding protein, partial [Hungatella sp.]